MSRGGQNNDNTKKLNKICVGYTDGTSVGHTDCLSDFLGSVELEQLESWSSVRSASTWSSCDQEPLER